MIAVQVQKAFPEPWTPPVPEAVRMWRPLPREVSDVLCAQRTGRCLPPHTHDEVEVLLPLSPACVTDGRGREARVEADGVAVFNPGDLHGLRAPDGGRWTARSLLVAPELLAGVWSDLAGAVHDDPPPFPDPVLHDAALAAELHAVFDDLRRPFAAAAAASRLRAALVRLVLRHSALPRPRAAGVPRHVEGVARVRDHLRAHVDAPLSLDDLAAVAGLGRFYLLRAFRREYGVSPHVYQVHLRLARARRLLARGVPPSHAAYSAGFADQSHLTRRLKETTGFTPAGFARQFTAAGPALAAVEPRARAASAA
ncbi:MAG TPA: AraC family transcriptional regulator [Longimicrobiaceae bacterium]|jgi:AraC-like DNA-binding protein